ncbi:hypothetical protein GCK72_022995 [Caenorhabditis remanei]|uniref:N-terminal methionine N(alpha)-acetyltransferase NatE n=1 Tax=Caenorhabditis remanei TaxID=31234 RepID=A0A6A5FVT6_CAERE|nr:hypothetical protein GCK72_022995 [Caenorhabditis remanei]KAF1746539.1 hypothetical protein GCK72_022995 [Caenorhabditis remanei]
MSTVCANGEQPGTRAQSNSVILREVTQEINSTLVESVFPNIFHENLFDIAYKMGELVRIAYIDGKLAGFLICELENGVVYISLIGVRVEYRRQGVGSALIQYAISFVRALKKDIQLHVEVGNTTAQQFYKQHGFIETERDDTYYDDPPRAAFVYTKKFNE